MPTGYTADVQTGKVADFRTFALRCARAFGATIMQRDDPMADLPKPREESSFYATSLREARAELARLEAMTLEQAAVEAEAEYQSLVQRRKEQAAKNAEEQARYNAMLARVEAWTPPSPDHEGLKKFMVEQLTEAKRFDSFEWDEPKRMDASAWLAEKRAKATSDVAYYAKMLHEEEQRVAQSNRWIQQLYDSL